MPYISRVLGASGLGKVDFATSVVSWFILFSNFGLLTYGVREVSKIRDNKEKLSHFFSEILLIKIIVTLLVLAVYIPCIFFINRLSIEINLFVLNGVLLITNIFSLDWFFQGVEDYRYITLRSIILKIISVIAIFLFVITKQHYLIYAGISIITLSLGNILNFIYARKFVNIIRIGLKIKHHIKPMMVFFLTTIVISIYTLLDQVLLGFIKGNLDIALYVRAKMFFNIGMSLSVAINNAITPRLNNYFVVDKSQYSTLLGTSLNLLLLISAPIMVGIGVLSRNLMELFGGVQFLPSSIALVILTPLLIITPISIWNYQQRILPRGHEKFGLYANSVVAIISLILNILLIPKLGYKGTAISWLTAEFTGLLINLIYTYSKDGFKVFKLSQLKYITTAAIMGFMVWAINYFLPLSWFNLFISVVVGAAIYFFILLLIKEENITLLFKMGIGILKRYSSSRK
jgi:O-antigen/teichoic acid export membrane protein